MKSITSEHIITVMSSKNKPNIYIDSGEIIEIHTMDCFSNKIKSEQQILSELSWDSINPCTGPIYINDAEKGDVLRIKVLEIDTNTKGVVIKDKGDMLKYSVDEREKSLFVSIEDERIFCSNKVTIPATPMIGVIGTAPCKDEIPTTLPGVHGGNMDNKMIKKGSILYLPVFHPGALLAVGDLHAAMGDGESMGCGIEVSGRVILEIEVLKNSFVPTPMVEVDNKVIMVASASSLDTAAELSVKMMLDYMIKNRNIESDLAWKIISGAGEVKICQFANKIKTVRCELYKHYLLDI